MPNERQNQRLEIRLVINLINMKTMKKLYIILITLLTAITASAINYHVKPTGTDTYSGSSWTLAKQSLQNTINLASAGDTIFVAVGEYSGGFMMREGITVMGGYTANTTMPRERILPADAADESQMSILDGGGTQRALIQITDFATPTFWDGFVIRNGTSVSSEVTVGSLVYAENGMDIVGIVYQFDGENGKMLSFAESKQPWGFYQYEFTELPYLGTPANDMKGKENTQLIIDKCDEMFPPISSFFLPNIGAWCKSLSAGWYLPSVGEWLEIYAAKSEINSIFIAANTKLANGYWTSNHAGELLAWAFYFENGKSVPTLKYIQKNVRAIRSFTASELTPPAPAESSVLLKNNGILDHSIVDGKEVVGVSDISAEKINLQIFPNPVQHNESFTVISNNETGSLKLIDISGKVIFSKKITGNETTITAPKSAGVYFLQLLGKTVKVVVY